MSEYDEDFMRHFDEDEAEDVTCKYCGAEGLWWVHTGVSWVLYEDHKPHECNKPDLDAFQENNDE